MSEPERPQNSAPEAGKEKPVEGTAPAEAKPKLTPEEQMALYEEHLKETDWGHQPC